jgi:hypothetical protein
MLAPRAFSLIPEVRRYTFLLRGLARATTRMIDAHNFIARVYHAFRERQFEKKKRTARVFRPLCGAALYEVQGFGALVGGGQRTAPTPPYTRTYARSMIFVSGWFVRRCYKVATSNVCQL